MYECYEGMNEPVWRLWATEQRNNATTNYTDAE